MLKKPGKIFSLCLFVLLVAYPYVSDAATITYTYDNLNRLTKVAYADGTTEEFTYDPAGNRLTHVIIQPDTTPPNGTVTMNGGAAYTSSTSVNLTISADADATQMCVSNATSCSSWEAYATSKPWTLASGDGEKLVYIWFKDAVGNTNTAPFSDSIILDSTGPAGSVAIDGGATYTNTTAVTLALSGTDSGSGVSQMCIGNTSSCSTWEAYATSKPWTLPTGDGEKTVYAWFKDSLGNANLTPFSDSIILDTTAPTPNPMTWATPPYQTGTTSISMVATTATDTATPVSYFLNFVNSPTGGTGGADSGWQSGTSYTNTGLGVNHQYGYRVKAKDGVNNETGYSTPTQYAYTAIDAPTGISFGTVSSTSIQIQSADTPSGLTRGNSGLLIENVTNGTNSGWKQNNNIWNSNPLLPNTSQTFRAKARNGDGVETGYSPTASKYTLPMPL